MLTQEDYWMIKELHEQGLYRKDIADRLGVHPKTVTRALRQGDAPSRSRRRQKCVKLKPYLGKVDELLARLGYFGEWHDVRDNWTYDGFTLVDVEATA